MPLITRQTLQKLTPGWLAPALLAAALGAASPA